MKKKLLALALALAIIGSSNLFTSTISGSAAESDILWENDFDTGYATGATAIQGFDTFSTINPAGTATPPSNWDGTYQYGGGGTNYNGKVVRKVEDGNGMMSFQHSGTGVTTMFVTKNMGVISEKPKLVLQYRARVTKSENTYYSLLWRDDAVPRMSGPSIQGYQKKILKYDNAGNSRNFTVGQWYDIAVFYDNATNTRKTYIDGEYVGEANNTKSTYYQDGRAIFWLEASGLDYATTIDVDDIRLRKYADFEARLPKTTEVSRTSVEVDFSFLPDPADMTTGHIEITRNGDTTNTPITIASIKKSPDSRKWLVKTANAMTLGENYTITLSNVRDLDGRMINNQPLSFRVTTTDDSILWENDFDTGYAIGATAIQGFDTFSTITPAGTATAPSYWDGTYQYGGGGTNYNGKVVRKVENGNGMMSFQHSGAGVTDLFVTKNMGVISEKPKLLLQYRARVTKAENTYYNLLWRDNAATRMSGPSIQGYQKKIVKYDNASSSMQYTVGQWYDIAVFYDNATNTRKTYIDGAYIGEANNTNATYYQDGRAIFWLEANGLDNATTIDVDDIRLRKYADFEARLPKTTEVSRTSVEVDFSFLPDPADMTTGHIEITRNGDETSTPILIESIEKSPDSRKWLVKTDEAMAMGGQYTFTLSNLNDLEGRIIENQSLSFTVTSATGNITAAQLKILQGTVSIDQVTDYTTPLTMSAKITNLTGTNQPFILILAAYIIDEDDRQTLENVVVEEIMVVDGIYTYSMTIEELDISSIEAKSGTKLIRAFIWDGSGSLVPLGEGKTIAMINND